ncbi:PAS domain S-box protein [Methanoculleus chikugoensis]|uniref:PAS domain-containing protein n=1 Tax=Methanoculleus chikugoensis TaxID=118126 RepID=UPI0006D1EAD7|nr:PAS domain-containing protein [Methanoculleus chikugoensis]
MRLPDGGEGRFRCSCRAVHDGRLRGSRLVRFSPDTSGPGGAVPVSETRAFRVDGPGRGGMDTAKRRRIEAILRESEDRYRFLVENLNEGIALIDREGIVVFANRKMADIIGYSIAGIIGAPVYAFIDEGGVPET